LGVTTEERRLAPSTCSPAAREVLPVARLPLCLRGAVPTRLPSSPP